MAVLKDKDERWEMVVLMLMVVLKTKMKDGDGGVERRKMAVCFISSFSVPRQQILFTTNFLLKLKQTIQQRLRRWRAPCFVFVISFCCFCHHLFCFCHHLFCFCHHLFCVCHQLFFVVCCCFLLFFVVCCCFCCFLLFCFCHQFSLCSL